VSLEFGFHEAVFGMINLVGLGLGKLNKPVGSSRVADLLLNEESPIPSEANSSSSSFLGGVGYSKF
jgi:hypothetical protein